MSEDRGMDGWGGWMKAINTYMEEITEQLQTTFARSKPSTYVFSSNCMQASWVTWERLAYDWLTDKRFTTLFSSLHLIRNKNFHALVMCPYYGTINIIIIMNNNGRKLFLWLFRGVVLVAVGKKPARKFIRFSPRVFVCRRALCSW